MIAAIYARKSTEQNGVADEAKSVTRQVEHARNFAARKGWTVADDSVFVDDGISGAEFHNRPGFQRLMAAATKRPRPLFQVLIVSEVSRLGREMFETNNALKTLITSSVRVWAYLADREVEINGATDKFMLSATAFADEIERERASLRTKDALQRKAQAGYVTGGRVFGYRNHDVTIGVDAHGRPIRSHVERRINEDEAAVVREIFDLAALGVGRAAIAKKLNEQGRPSPRAAAPATWLVSIERARSAVPRHLSRSDHLEQYEEARSIRPRQSARPAGVGVDEDGGASAPDRV